MAKSIRSKRRQRVLAVRRDKYRAVERKKCWDHQLRRGREKTEDMDGVVVEENESKGLVEGGHSPDEAGGGVLEAGGEGAMETDADKPKFSKKYLERLSQAWRNRHDRRKRKRLSNNRKQK